MAATIRLSNGQILDVVVLDRDAYYGSFTRSIYAPPDLTESYTDDDLIDEKRSTEEALRHALRALWVEVEDFEVGSDSNFAFTMCGGIYSPRTICREYLEILHAIVGATRHHEYWSYDTSVELREPVDGMTGISFVLRQNVITVLDWGLGDFSFAARFGLGLGNRR